MKTLLRICLLLLFNISFCLNTYPQNPITWEKILNNAYGNLLKAHQTPDKNFIAVGSDLFGVGYKMYHTKWGFTGDSLWTRMIGIPFDTDGYWIENTFDKGFIICGSKNSDAYLLKTDSTGNVVWDAVFGGGELDQAYCVKQTSDSGLIVIIRTTSFSNYNNIMVVKTNKWGNTQWQKIFITNNTQFAHEVIESNFGYYIIGSAFNDIYLMRLNLSGDTLWTKRLGTQYLDDGYSIQLDYNNGLIIGGISYTSSNVSKSMIINTDSSGKAIWQKTYSVEHNELLFSVRTLPKKGYVFCGTTDSVFGDLEKGFIRIIDLNGNVIHEKFYRALPYFTEIRSVETTTDNGLILCGVTQAVSGGHPKMYLVKTDSIGNIYPVGIENNQTEIPDEFNLYQNYPNPFNSTTIIEIDVKKKTDIELTIFDITGRQISKLERKNLIAGNYKYRFTFKDKYLSSGVYFYSLKAGNKILTRKMFYIK